MRHRLRAVRRACLGGAVVSSFKMVSASMASANEYAVGREDLANVGVAATISRPSSIDCGYPSGLVGTHGHVTHGVWQVTGNPLGYGVQTFGEVGVTHCSYDWGSAATLYWAYIGSDGIYRSDRFNGFGTGDYVFKVQRQGFRIAGAEAYEGRIIRNGQPDLVHDLGLHTEPVDPYGNYGQVGLETQNRPDSFDPQTPHTNLRGMFVNGSAWTGWSGRDSCATVNDPPFGAWITDTNWKTQKNGAGVVWTC